MKKLSVQRLTICAAMIALHIVLEFVSIRIGNDYKITFSGLPIIIIAFIFGPLSGFIVGLIGSVLSQLLTFGITATTIFWIWPPAIHGLVVGLLFAAFGRKLAFSFNNNKNGAANQTEGVCLTDNKAGTNGNITATTSDSKLKKVISTVVNPVTVCVFAGGLVNTICNYIATYFDSKVWNYYSEIYMIGLIPIRIVNWVLTAVVCSVVAMIVIRVLYKRFPRLIHNK